MLSGAAHTKYQAMYLLAFPLLAYAGVGIWSLVRAYWKGRSPELLRALRRLALAVGAAIVGVCLDWSFLHGTHPFGKFIALTPSLAGGPITDTARPGEFHGMVAFASTLFVAGGLLVAVYFYLGSRREIQRLRSAMDCRGFAGLRGLEWTSRLSSQPAVAAVGRAATAAGLGGLASFLGRVLLLILIVLSTPLLLAYYVSPYKLSYRKFFFDEIYTAFVVWPLRAAAYVSYAVDRWIVDGLVNLCGWIPVAVGALLRFTQIGLVQFYALAMVVGALVLIAAKLLWATG
jgi:NADH-quinone oxidoreductase subunit L